MGLIVARSPHDVTTTVDRIAGALRRRGITEFARIDHAAGAREAGLELDDEVLLVFGSPAVGTALMRAASPGLAGLSPSRDREIPPDRVCCFRRLGAFYPAAACRRARLRARHSQ